jgi:hypothetical protein
MLLKKSLMVGAGKFSALLARPARGAKGATTSIHSKAITDLRISLAEACSGRGNEKLTGDFSEMLCGSC